MKISTILGIALILCTVAFLSAQEVDSTSGNKGNETDAPGSLGRYFVLVNCKSCKIDSALLVKGSEKNKTSQKGGSKPMDEPGNEKTGEHFDDYNRDDEYENYGDDYPPNEPKRSKPMEDEDSYIEDYVYDDDYEDKDYLPREHKRPNKPEKYPSPAGSSKTKPQNKPMKLPCQKKGERGDDYSDEDSYAQDYGYDDDYEDKDYLPREPKRPNKPEKYPSPQGSSKAKPQNKPMKLPCQKKEERGDDYSDEDSYAQDYEYGEYPTEKIERPKPPKKYIPPPGSSKEKPGNQPMKLPCQKKNNKDYKIIVEDPDNNQEQGTGYVAPMRGDYDDEYYLHEEEERPTKPKPTYVVPSYEFPPGEAFSGCPFKD